MMARDWLDDGGARRRTDTVRREEVRAMPSATVRERQGRSPSAPAAIERLAVGPPAASDTLTTGVPTSVEGAHSGSCEPGTADSEEDRAPFPHVDAVDVALWFG